MIAGILLAAGEARRFGADKLLHPLADGLAVGVRAALNLQGAVDVCRAVVRTVDSEIARELSARGVHVVACADSAGGMAQSIRCGVTAAADATGWIIALADMPFIAPATIRRVASALADGAPAVVPIYRGQPGHPVGFGTGLRAELLALSGDHGAREVLRRHAAQVRRIVVEDPGVCRDIDRPQDALEIGEAG